uniref:Putative secreted protein n=1 Tax=Anopheles darlingi TaxID=43151 RepID=A0A2M4D9M6_ANODA
MELLSFVLVLEEVGARNGSTTSYPLLAAPLAITQNILRPTQRQSGSRTKTHAITFASAIAATCAWRFAVVHGFPGAPRSYNPITDEKAPSRNLIFRKTRNAKKILIF